MGDLTEDFSEWEFRCKCRCGICIVDAGFLIKLQNTRTLADIRFIVMSGCRCPSYNKDEKGSSTSDHITTETMACEGADIFCGNSVDRYKILDAAFNIGFRRIGIAKEFIHLGTSNRNPQEVVWLY